MYMRMALRIDSVTDLRKKLGYSRSYSGWREKTGQKHPNWTSWNYGLLIDWDNSPEKDKVSDSKKDSSIEYYI